MDDLVNLEIQENMIMEEERLSPVLKGNFV